ARESYLQKAVYVEEQRIRGAEFEMEIPLTFWMPDIIAKKPGVAGLSEDHKSLPGYSKGNPKQFSLELLAAQELGLIVKGHERSQVAVGRQIISGYTSTDDVFDVTYSGPGKISPNGKTQAEEYFTSTKKFTTPPSADTSGGAAALAADKNHGKWRRMPTVFLKMLRQRWRDILKGLFSDECKDNLFPIEKGQQIPDSYGHNEDAEYDPASATGDVAPARWGKDDPLFRTLDTNDMDKHRAGCFTLPPGIEK
ncbi:unnamed protein product, partial [Amoebophrya sp. A25]